MRTLCLRAALAWSLGFGVHVAQAQYQEDNTGYVLIQAESTKTSLGMWTKGSTIKGFTGSGYLEFTGNTPTGGSPASPIEYTFTITQGGVYTLYVNIAPDLQGAGALDCNDIYVKVTGDYTTAAGGAPLTMLNSDTQLHENTTTSFAWSNGFLNLDGGSDPPARYTFKSGQTYTLTISGRSQRTMIDRILFATSASLTVGQNPATPESPSKPIIQGPRAVFTALKEFQKVVVAGYANYSNDPVMGALYINASLDLNHKKWAAAEMVFNGDAGLHDIYLYALKETDGETSYKISQNGKQLGTTFKNPSINLDSRRIGEVQTFVLRDQALKKGDVIRVESDCATNGLVPKDSTTAFAEGRWSKLEIVPKFINTTSIHASARPNPYQLVGGSFYFSASQPGPVTLRFYELSGRLVATQKLNVTGPLTANIKVETGTLQPGIYWVSSSGKDSKEVQRIVLSK